MSTGPINTVTVCRATRQAASLIESLERLGLVVVEFPLLEIVEPPDGGQGMRAALDRLSDFDWVAFTSANAVSAFHQALGSRDVAHREWPDSTRVAAVGRATSQAIASIGRPVDLLASPATAGDLARQLPLTLGDLVLAPLGVLASDDLVDGVKARGASIERVDAYATTTPEHRPEDLTRALQSDVVLLTAPSVVDRLVELAAGRPLPSGICIGPKTLERANEFGIDVVAVANPHDDEGLVDAMHALLASRDDVS